MLARGVHRLLVLLGASLPLACEIHATTGYVPPPELPPPPPPIVLSEPEPGVTEVVPTEDAYADTDPSALTTFSATLQGHGSWVEDDEYGTVWVPAPEQVGPEFVPYVSAGHWAYGADYVWVSDYPWGWVTFHYGRWVFIADRGWAWIPGREYADAWVVWRVGDDDFDYVGWAPAPPTWIWRGGVALALGVAVPVSYVFCPHREIFEPHLRERIARGDTGWMERRTHPFGPAWAGDTQHPFEHRRPQGPPPESLHVDRRNAPPPPSVDEGLSRAHQYARPSTARQLGAAPPSRHLVRTAPAPPRKGVTAPQPPPPRKIAPRRLPLQSPTLPPAKQPR